MPHNPIRTLVVTEANSHLNIVMIDDIMIDDINTTDMRGELRPAKVPIAAGAAADRHSQLLAHLHLPVTTILQTTALLSKSLSSYLARCPPSPQHIMLLGRSSRLELQTTYNCRNLVHRN